MVLLIFFSSVSIQERNIRFLALSLPLLLIFTTLHCTFLFCISSYINLYLYIYFFFFAYLFILSQFFFLLFIPIFTCFFTLFQSMCHRPCNLFTTLQRGGYQPRLLTKLYNGSSIVRQSFMNTERIFSYFLFSFHLFLPLFSYNFLFYFLISFISNFILLLSQPLGDK